MHSFPPPQLNVRSVKENTTYRTSNKSLSCPPFHNPLTTVARTRFSLNVAVAYRVFHGRKLRNSDVGLLLIC